MFAASVEESPTAAAITPMPMNARDLELFLDPTPLLPQRFKISMDHPP